MITERLVVLGREGLTDQTQGCLDLTHGITIAAQTDAVTP